jgi:hypothetical protein
MSHFYTVSDAARLLGVRPRDISDLFYQRWISDELCPVVGTRRLIPWDALPLIRDALQVRRREQKLAGG